MEPAASETTKHKFQPEVSAWLARGAALFGGYTAIKSALAVFHDLNDGETVKYEGMKFGLAIFIAIVALRAATTDRSNIRMLDRLLGLGMFVVTSLAAAGLVNRISALPAQDAQITWPDVVAMILMGSVAFRLLVRKYDTNKV